MSEIPTPEALRDQRFNALVKFIGDEVVPKYPDKIYYNTLPVSRWKPFFRELDSFFREKGWRLGYCHEGESHSYFACVPLGEKFDDYGIPNVLTADTPKKSENDLVERPVLIDRKGVDQALVAVLFAGIGLGSLGTAYFTLGIDKLKPTYSISEQTNVRNPIRQR